MEFKELDNKLWFKLTRQLDETNMSTQLKVDLIDFVEAIANENKLLRQTIVEMKDIFDKFALKYKE